MEQDADPPYIPVENPTNSNARNRLWRQTVLYFLFAGIMFLLNIGIQNFHEQIWIHWIEKKWGEVPFLQKTYLNRNIFDIPELIGSILAVGITYIVKFCLDKFLVFQSISTDSKETRKQFGLYLMFAVFTTLENLGIQFILNLWTEWSLNLRIFIALSCGYITKFLLDRKYCFSDNSPIK